MPIEETVYSADELQLELVCKSCGSAFPASSLESGFHTSNAGCSVCGEPLRQDYLKSAAQAWTGLLKQISLLDEFQARFRYSWRESEGPDSDAPNSE